MKATKTALACTFLLIASCDTGDPVFPDVSLAIGDAVAFGVWAPGPQDTCSAEIHDSYAALGPDGLRYPTWHPAVDPATGCTFGHEHGRDPSGSDVYGLVGPIPFGYANQHLEAGGFGAPRNEDHVGHKVEWENDMLMRIDDGGGAALAIECDLLVKMHQGTHSPDAFANNMHEVAYHVRCSDRTGFSITVLTPIGTAGELVASCDRDRHIPIGTPNPPISPDGGGKRAIPDASCVQEQILNPADGRPRFDSALRESWEISVSLRTTGNRSLASFNPYFQVMDPSRFFDPNASGTVGRPIDLCYRPGVQGEDRCEGLPLDTLSWDDPASPFKGVRRFVDVNSNRIRNAEGPSVWYTDSLGKNGRTEPFPGSIRQWIGTHDNSNYDLHGPVIGRDRPYDAPGVHAPN
ncbi:MAG: hypothetical protein OEO79_09180 [Gemmatimonadota bacterium]|nr:hypothetical protein [Gemmatimonadota bacterium]